MSSSEAIFDLSAAVENDKNTKKQQHRDAFTALIAQQQESVELRALVGAHNALGTLNQLHRIAGGVVDRSRCLKEKQRKLGLTW